MTSDNSNIEVSSFPFGGGTDEYSSHGPGPIVIPALHNSINNCNNNNSGGENGAASPLVPKKRKSLWKRLLKRGASSSSSVPSSMHQHTSAATPQQQQPILFEASFENAPAAIPAAGDANNCSNGRARAAVLVSPATPLTTTADLLRHRAARRNGNNDGSIGGQHRGCHSLSASEASRSHASAATSATTMAVHHTASGQDRKALVVDVDATASSAAATRDRRTALAASTGGLPPSPAGSAKHHQQHQQLSSSSTITSSSVNQQQHQYPHQPRAVAVVDPFSFRHPPLSPRGGGGGGGAHPGGGSGKSVASKGGGGSTVCQRGEQMTLVTSTTASMTASTTPTTDRSSQGGDGGNSVNPSLIATPTMQKSIGGAKGNRPAQGSTAIPRLGTPMTEPPLAAGARRMDPSSTTSVSSSRSSNDNHHLSAVVAANSGRWKMDPPSSSLSPPDLAAATPKKTAIRMDPVGGGNFFREPVQAAEWTLQEEDQTDAMTPAGGSTATASSCQRRRRRLGGNTAGSTVAINGAGTDEGSAGSGTKNRDASGRDDGSVGAAARRKKSAQQHRRDDSAGEGAFERFDRVTTCAGATGGANRAGTSLVTFTPMQASGSKHSFQGGPSVAVAADDDEEAEEGEISSSDIMMNKNNSNNNNNEGLSSLVVEEVTRYITNPSTIGAPLPNHHHYNTNDNGNNHIMGSSSRGPRVGKAAMSRFTSGKNKGSSASAMMMPKTPKLSRKKKTVPFSRGVGNNDGFGGRHHDSRPSQDKKAAHKNGDNSSPLQPPQEMEGEAQRTSGDGSNIERIAAMDTGINTLVASTEDNNRENNSPKRGGTPPPSSTAYNNQSNAKIAAAASPGQNDNTHHPHLYAEINIPVSTKLSKRQSSAKSSASNHASTAVGGGGDNVSLAMTSISSLTGRSSIFAVPATEGGIGIGIGGAAGINSMYASMLPNVWCSNGGGVGSDVGNHNNNSRLSHPYREENYFDYDEDEEGNGRKGMNAMNMGNPNSDSNGYEEDGIMERVFGAWNDAFKSTCRCFDVAGGDGEPLWGGGRGGGDGNYHDAVGETKPMAVENASTNNNDATAPGCAITIANFSKPSKSSITNSSNKAGPSPPMFSEPMDIFERQG